MPYLLLGIVLLAGLLIAAKVIVHLDPARTARFLGWFVAGIAATGAVVIVVLLLVSDRFAPALVVAGGLTPVFLRSRALWRRYYGSTSRSSGGSSDVETELLRMRLDHDTGAMTGQVKRGTFAGRRLEDLTQEDLIVLWRQCIAEDEPSARLLESYLDRLRPDWRQGMGGGSTGGTPGDAMTRDEAYAILDLAPGADAEQIKEAHHRLMMKLHPDHGGSTFLAAQINRAKEILLGG